MNYYERTLQLFQAVDIEDTNIAANGNLTPNIRTNGFRGLAIIVPSVWTAADIAFYGVSGDTIVPLYDEEGALVVIASVAVAASRLYIAPASAWALGAFPHFRIASVDTSTGALKNQTALRELKVVFLR